MAERKSGILQGTLDLMVLKTLDAMGPLHGYGIARRLEQISEASLQVNQGTMYASLLRLLQKRWIAGAWGTSKTTAGRSSTRSRRPGAGSSPLKPRIGRACPA